eukprot:TRINITY_DN691_c0_g1_i1.p1 TRINITY_DN691_c0_g1~~TRINITY_DN691_c0_g1_i1.p1  ORF type:complete len:548 (+),score=47.84 TRINITY_DN691_c0_g1_i1:255-1898(+)
MRGVEASEKYGQEGRYFWWWILLSGTLGLLLLVTYLPCVSVQFPGRCPLTENGLLSVYRSLGDYWRLNTTGNLETRVHWEGKESLSGVPSLRRKLKEKNITPPQFVIERTQLKHLLFTIVSSANTWAQRSPYVRSWWMDQPGMRGYVWVDANTSGLQEGDPELRVGRGTDHLAYSGIGTRACLRGARAVVDAFLLKENNVRWYVQGDDDTFFNPEGLVAILAKYDHTKMMLIGGLSEDHTQRNEHSHTMPYGGGGYAVSPPLVSALKQTFDECIQRHPELYGSDARLSVCAAELGVSMTLEEGFHQCDIRGNMEGYLAAHKTHVFASLHHLERNLPVFPTMVDRLLALHRLARAMRADPVGFLQQSICYHSGGDWTASIAWGYSVKFWPRTIRLVDLTKTELTFQAESYSPKKVFQMDYRSHWPMPKRTDVCAFPFVLYNVGARRSKEGSVVSIYHRPTSLKDADRRHCPVEAVQLRTVRVIRRRPMAVPYPNDGMTTGPALLRQCCNKMAFEPEKHGVGLVGTFWLGDCSQSNTIKGGVEPHFRLN